MIPFPPFFAHCPPAQQPRLSPLRKSNLPFDLLPGRQPPTLSPVPSNLAPISLRLTVLLSVYSFEAGQGHLCGPAP